MSRSWAPPGHWTVLVAVLVVGAVTACGPRPQRHYYTLTGASPATRFDKPFPIKLRVRDLDMRRSYRRDELVFRNDAHELIFSRSRRWSEPPQRMIGNLIRAQVRRSGIAAEVQDERSIVEPDYLLSGNIEAIEQINVGRDKYAHIEGTYRLSRFSDDATLWTFRIDARRPVSGTSVRSTVRVLSEILAAETGRTSARPARTPSTSPRSGRPARSRSTAAREAGP
jgi:ABC-type uncharacterized transport system auxiliary subunit